jgi:uncharacterized membrane protein
VTSTILSRFGIRIAVTYLVAATAWLVALAAAPYLLVHRAPGTVGFQVAEMVYLAGGRICHQQSARSFHAWGIQLPVCARCTGLYLAAPAGALAGIVAWRKRRGTGSARLDRWRWVLALAAAPMALTVGLEWVGLAEIPGLLRAGTSLPLGFAVSWLVAATLMGAGRREEGSRIRGTDTPVT